MNYMSIFFYCRNYRIGRKESSYIEKCMIVVVVGGSCHYMAKRPLCINILLTLSIILLSFVPENQMYPFPSFSFTNSDSMEGVSLPSRSFFSRSALQFAVRERKLRMLVLSCFAIDGGSCHDLALKPHELAFQIHA